MPLQYRRIPVLPARPRVHPIAGQIRRSYSIGRQIPPCGAQSAEDFRKQEIDKRKGISDVHNARRPAINPKPSRAPPKPANAKPPDIASASVPDTLAALHVNPDTGLTHAEVDVRRKEHGYNEVAEKKGHPRPQVPPEILGNLGVDARTDHGSVGRAREIIRTSPWWARCWSSTLC